ncbi:MAG: ABC transporter permease [Hydrogenophaga sp.]|nr:ABC transporter permease [Hydrogenophaga sp.]
MNVRSRELVVSTLSVMGFLLLWEVLSRTGVVDARILAPPSSVAATLVELAANGQLSRALTYTVVRFAVGMILGTVPGIVLGLTIGLFRWARVLIQPLISVFYMVPRIAMFPLVLIFLGLNEQSNIVMIALGPFFTMVITSAAAVRNIDPIYPSVAKSFNTGTWDLYMRVTLPAALPVIFGGIRVSLGLALLGTVAVEFLVASEGLGHLIWRSWQILSMSLSVAGLVAASAVGMMAYGLLGLLERYVMPWQQR